MWLSSPAVTDGLRVSCATFCTQTIVSNSHRWVYAPEIPPFLFQFLLCRGLHSFLCNELHASIRKLCGKSISFCLSLIISLGACVFLCCKKMWKIILYKPFLSHLSFVSLLAYYLRVFFYSIYFHLPVFLGFVKQSSWRNLTLNWFNQNDKLERSNGKMNSFSPSFYRSSSEACHHPGLLHLYLFRFYICHEVGWYELPAVQKIHLHHCLVQNCN